VGGFRPEAGWLRKHAHTLPAVVLLVKAFDGAATTSDAAWDASEARAADEIGRLRAQLAPRECALLVLLLRRRAGGDGGGGGGAAAGGGGALSELEEGRVASLRRRCASSLEPNSLFVLDHRNELHPNAPTARRLAATVRRARSLARAALARMGGVGYASS